MFRGITVNIRSASGLARRIYRLLTPRSRSNGYRPLYGMRFLSLGGPPINIPAVKALLFLALSLASAKALEPWADTRLAVTNGMQLWLDASREPAAREARKLAAPLSGRP